METATSLPQITTVIPTYNRPQLLRRALRSVLNQNFRDFRVCIYGDTSGEETAAAVAQVAQGDPRVQYLRHTERKGIARNFLYGMERVETPFFSFLSDDDILLPDFYLNALEGFQKCPEAAFSAMGVLLMDLDERRAVMASRAWPEGICRPPDGLRNMLKLYPPLWTAILFRRDLIEKVGLLDAEVGNGCDIDYTMRVLAHHSMVFSHRLGALGTVHATTASRMTRLEDVWPGTMRLIHNTVDDNRTDAQLRGEASRVLLARLKRVLFVDCGLHAAIQGRGDEARRSATILSRELGETRRARWLRLIDGVHRAFPPLRKLSSFALDVRRRLKMRRNKPEMQRQAQSFREYERFLELV